MPVKKGSKKSFRLPKRGQLKIEDFKYADQLGITLPQLVLGIEVDPRSEYARAYKFKPGRAWLKLAHQTAGHACHQHYLYATLLQPKTVEIAQRMNILACRWHDSQVGVFGARLDTVITYRSDLQKLFEADCNDCHTKFEEGYLPIDIDYIGKLAADQLPKDLDDLIDFASGWERGMGCVGRFGLYCLAENSD